MNFDIPDDMSNLSVTELNGLVADLDYLRFRVMTERASRKLAPAYVRPTFDNLPPWKRLVANIVEAPPGTKNSSSILWVAAAIALLALAISSQVMSVGKVAVDATLKSAESASAGK